MFGCAAGVGGGLSGSKWPVADGGIADIAIVAARDEGSGEIALFVTDLTEATVSRRNLTTIDPSRNHAQIEFTGTDVEKLGAIGDGLAGGAGSCWSARRSCWHSNRLAARMPAWAMALGYAIERYAFGRPIGSFQAIKHKLADVYVAIELARSNAIRRVGAVRRCG